MARHDFDNTLMAALDSPLIVVTTADERERAGCLVEFHGPSSIEPQRYCVWLSKANYTYRVALHSSHLVIHFLTADDLPLAELFGTQTGIPSTSSPAVPVDPGPGGAPVLRQCPNWLAVRRIALLDEGGDHVCLTTEPVAVQTAGSFRPLRISQAGQLAAAEAVGLAHRVIRHGPVRSLAEAARARGVAPADVVKTLVVRRGEDDFLFVLVPGNRVISWPKLRALLGASRLSMPDAEVARQVTGYERGTITPLGSVRRWPVIADERMRGREITLGAGEHGLALAVDADEILQALDASVADISDPEPAA